MLSELDRQSPYGQIREDPGRSSLCLRNHARWLQELLICGLRLSLAVAAVLAALISPAAAFPDGNTRPVVVTSDPGGRVDYRAAEISRFMTAGRSVIIDGHCASACTMYLAIGCVTPRASLVFHGPSYYGIPLGQRDFEYWSRIIAGYYPPALAKWFMESGRYRTQFSQPLDAEQIVALGGHMCS